MDPVLWAILLLLVGLALIVLEVFLPSGGALSVLAAVAILGAVALGFQGGSRSGAAVLAAAAVLVPVFVALGIRWWPKTPMGRMMLLREPESEDEVLPDNEQYHLRDQMLGRRGKAKTKMLPSGSVIIDGRTYDAVSDGMAVEPGQPVRVVAVRTNRIVVRPVDSEEGGQAPDPLDRPIETVGPDPFDEPLA